MRKRMFMVMALPILLCAGCKEDTGNQKAAVKPPVAVESATAKTAAVTEGIDVTGTLEPKSSVDVKTQIPGLVKQVYVNEWVRVKKGQPLARIDVAETEAQVRRAEAAIAAARAAQLQSQAAQARAEREQARILKLKESGLATQQAVDDARTETEAARARTDAAKAQTGVAEEEARQARARLAKGVVSAPIDGVVALKQINVGDLASDAAAGKPVFRIVDNRLLNLTVAIPSTDSARVKAGQKLRFSVDSLPDMTFSGTVMFINPELSAADRSLKVIAEIRNVPETLKGGLFAKGRIITGTRDNALLVPRSALSAWDTAAGTASINVLAQNIARVRPVRTGIVLGDQVEIISGLKPGEQYVVRGGFNLKDGDAVATSGVKP